ncbi:hypothetical protein [uncultured Thiodictyon sp.]|uniref:hypothetical protein n=1 Tax=uncultured Thiodictyon sp. TaxID=1846217 RepID=UPI0025CD7F63|nr:hypothetical protein [uncultured Thiodictyon sp.]
MKNLKRDSLLETPHGDVPSIDSDTVPLVLRTDGYESGYARGTQEGAQFALSLRSRRRAGEIIVPSEFGRVIQRAMIRWDAVGGRDMSIQPLAQRTAAFETVRGEIYGFSAGLIDAF